MSDADLFDHIKDIGSTLDDALDISKSYLEKLDNMSQGAAAVFNKLDRHCEELKSQFIDRVKSGEVSAASADLAYETAQKMLVMAKKELLSIEQLRLMKEGEISALTLAVRVVKKKYDDVERLSMSPSERKLDMSRQLSEAKKAGVAPRRGPVV